MKKYFLLLLLSFSMLAFGQRRGTLLNVGSVIPEEPTNLNLNSTFDDATNLTLDSCFSVSGGTLNFDDSASGDAIFALSENMVSGTTYEVTVEQLTGSPAGIALIASNGTTEWTIIGMTYRYNVQTITTSYTHTGVDATQFILRATKDAGASAFAVDNVVVKEFVPTPVISVSISPPTADVQIGLTKQLSVVFNPIDADDTTGSWDSGTTAVATVNSTTGLVTTIAEGSSIITYTSTDGPSDTATINVVPLSTNLILNGTFNDATYLTVEPEWTIGSGVASYDGIAYGFVSFDLNQEITDLTMYTLQFDMVSVGTQGRFYVDVEEALGGTFIAQPYITYDEGFISIPILTPTGTDAIALLKFGGATNTPSLYSIDNVVLFEGVPESSDLIINQTFTDNNNIKFYSGWTWTDKLSYNDGGDNQQIGIVTKSLVANTYNLTVTLEGANPRFSILTPFTNTVLKAATTYTGSATPQVIQFTYDGSEGPLNMLILNAIGSAGASSFTIDDLSLAINI